MSFDGCYPEHVRDGIPPGWTEVNASGKSPYLHYCRECDWASSIAGWSDGRPSPYCPRCGGTDLGLLTPGEWGA